MDHERSPTSDRTHSQDVHDSSREHLQPLPPLVVPPPPPIAAPPPARQAGVTSPTRPIPPVPEHEEYPSRADTARPRPERMVSEHRPYSIRKSAIDDIGDVRQSRPRSQLDWIVPEKPVSRLKTASERLEPTLHHARRERAKYRTKARAAGYALNVAIGLQVLLGALTTGLSVVTTGKQTSIMTAILGGLATVVASYLARARGSNEPELSIQRTKDLDHFLRDCQSFQMDRGWVVSRQGAVGGGGGGVHTESEGDVDPDVMQEADARIEEFRRRFEELLGNANQERRMALV